MYPLPGQDARKQCDALNADLKAERAKSHNLAVELHYAKLATRTAKEDAVAASNIAQTKLEAVNLGALTMARGQIPSDSYLLSCRVHVGCDAQ